MDEGKEVGPVRGGLNIPWRSSRINGPWPSGEALLGSDSVLIRHRLVAASVTLPFDGLTTVSRIRWGPMMSGFVFRRGEEVYLFSAGSKNGEFEAALRARGLQFQDPPKVRELTRQVRGVFPNGWLLRQPLWRRIPLGLAPFIALAVFKPEWLPF
jgi:hypothetical protein